MKEPIKMEIFQVSFVTTSNEIEKNLSTTTDSQSYVLSFYRVFSLLTTYVCLVFMNLGQAAALLGSIGQNQPRSNIAAARLVAT
jgi:hypothetical protein